MTIAEAEELHLKAVELNKFVHYYTRFKNHEHSYKIEEPLLAMAKQKFEILTAQQNAATPISFNSAIGNEANSQHLIVHPRRTSSTSGTTSTPTQTPKFNKRHQVRILRDRYV